MWLFLTQYVKNKKKFFLLFWLFGAIMWLFGVDRTFSQHFCNKMGQKKKKKNRIFFDFLGLNFWSKTTSLFVRQADLSSLWGDFLELRWPTITCNNTLHNTPQHSPTLHNTPPHASTPPPPHGTMALRWYWPISSTGRNHIFLYFNYYFRQKKKIF